MSFLPVAVIPVYNHPHRLAGIVDALRALDLPVILVDDGSDAATARVIDSLAGSVTSVERLPGNRGKGVAVLAGISRARALGYTHAVQVDADGQHDLDAVPALLAAARAQPSALVSGCPQYDASIPKSRLHGRRITHFFTAIETLSLQVSDAMCGFRVYPVDATLDVARTERVGARMDFDTEIMVRLYWRGVPLRFLPVHVTYPADGISHFRLLADNWRITKMHTRLCFGMLPRAPRLLTMPRAHDGAWARQAERGSLWGMRLVAMIARWLGHAPARALLHPVTLYFFLVHGRARHASRQYLRRVNAKVPPALREHTRESAANIYRHFFSFSRSVFEKLAAWQSPDRLPPVTVHGGEMLDELRDGRGMLFFSAHLGNLDMCRALAHRNPELKINALVYTRNAKKFSSLMTHLNPDFSERLILVDAIGADTAVQLRTLLDRGEIIVMVGDRTPASENGHVVSAEFLGAPAPFATGPYVLAHLLECPVGLLFCLPGASGGYEIFLDAFADRIRLPRGNREAELKTCAARFARRLEHYVLRQPLQWFNFYNFWAEESGATPVLAGKTTVDG